MNMLNRLLALSLALSLIFLHAEAQTVHPDYQDGKIYLKIKDGSPLTFRSLDELRTNDHFHALLGLFDEYGVTEATRPFITLKTPVFDRTYKIVFSQTEGVYGFMRELDKIPYVEYAEQVELLRPTLVPNDPNIGNQYHLTNIQAYDAWDIHTGGNAVVAIVDDAVRITHNDLAPNVWQNPGETPNNGIDDDGNGYIDDYNGFDVADNDNNPNPPGGASDFSFSHGTHCAGIACGATNNGTGIASIGFNNKIMAVKCTSNNGNPQFVENGYEGVVYAMAAGADVISMSWGGSGSSNTAQNIFTQAHNDGITLVAAAGNDNTTSVFYPAGYDFVISVASTNQSDQKSSFSNYGSWIDISAPGSGILSTVATSTTSYQYYDGTSMACPMVAGLCGLLKSYDPSLTPDEIEGCITQSADNIDAQNPSYVGSLGAGRINAHVSLQCSNPTNPPVANFRGDNDGTLCPGGTVQFSDISIYGPTTWSWSFPGGTPATSTAQNPSVTYPNVGTYDVTLTVTNQYGTDSHTETGYVVVDITGTEEFYLADFENGGADWTVDNPDNATTWELATVGGTEGGATAAGMNNYNYNAPGQRDGLLSPVLDFMGRSNVTLDFDYAHRRYSQNEADSLVIYISSDGGTTFSRIYENAEDGTGIFATNTTTQQNFVPSTIDDWCYGGQVGASCPTLDLSAYDGMSNIVLKFENVNAYGNNTYIDNVRLTSSCYIPPGPPTADFTASTDGGCTGTVVQFTDTSYGNPAPDAWSWSFPGGTPSSSSLQNPSVAYNSEGTFNVTLTVSNASGSDSQTYNGIITISNSGINTFYVEDFESGAADWTVDNPDNATTWTLVTVGGTQSGTVAAGINNYNYNAPGQRDGLVSPVLDFTNHSNVTLDFDYAHRRYSQNEADSLIVYISANGGASFTRIYENAEDGTGSFATNTTTQNNFVPAITDDWCYAGQVGAGCPTLDLSAYDGMSNIVLKFENVNDYGNNTYVDNIYLTSTCAATGTAPSASFTANTTSGCEPFTLDLVDQSTGDPTSWSWTVAGPATYTSSQQNPSIIITQPGTYSVTLEVGNDFGTSSDTQVGYVTVTSAPTAGFTYNVTDGTVSFTNTSQNGSSYSWDFGDGNTSSVANPSHTYGESGTYTVSLTVTNECGSDTYSTDVSVTVGTAPSAAFTANATAGCEPFTLDLVDQSTGDPTTWSWTVSGPTTYTSSQQNPSIIITQSGTYSVTLEVGNDFGTSSDTQVGYVTVNSAPTAGFVFNVTDGTVSFINTSQNADSYSWDFGDGSSSSFTDPSHTYGASGTYTVALTVTNECGSDTYSTDVSVTVGTTPAAAFTANSTSGCEPFTLDLVDQSTGDPTTWSWTVSGPATYTSSQQNPSIIITEPGTYSVTLEVGNDFGTSSDTQVGYVTVDALPVAGFNYSVSSGTASFTNTSQNADSYVWDFGDGGSSASANPSHTYGASGTYTVSLTVTNNCGTDTYTSNVNVSLGSAPAANFTANATSGCAPFVVDFIDQSSNNPTSWNWTFSGPENLSSTSQNPTMTFSLPGVYSVTLEVANAEGSNTIVQNNYITVGEGPAAGFVFTDNGSGMIAFTSTSTNTDAYSWDFGDGSTSSSSDPDHTYGTPGTYTVSLTVTNECGTDTYTENVTVSFAVAPVADFSSSAMSGCAPFVVDFTDQSSNNPTSWNWTFSGPENLSSTQQNPSITFTVSGVYNVILEVTNAAGSNTIVQNNYITVNPLPAAGFTYNVNGGTASFTNTSQDANSYNWDFGDGGSSSSANPNYTYNASGTYAVTLTVTNDCGTDTYTANVSVTVDNTVAPNAAFSANAIEGCSPMTVDFSDESTNGPTSWNWSFPGGTPSSSTDQNPSVTYNSPGVYDVTLQVFNSAGNSSLVENGYIVVETVPEADFSYTEMDGNVSFANNSTNADSYFWDFGDGNSSTAENPIYTYISTGTYTITLTATNACGSVTSSQDVTVTVLGVDDWNLEATWDIRPNPNTGRFWVDIQGDDLPDMRLEIVDVLGRSLLSKEVAGQSVLEMDATALSPGTYFVRLSHESGQAVKRIVVTK